MTTTQIHRTELPNGVTVSTVRVRDGRAQWYETALVKGGKVSDSRRTAKKADAGYEHDAACAIVRGWTVDRGSVRAAFYQAALGEVGQHAP